MVLYEISWELIDKDIYGIEYYQIYAYMEQEWIVIMMKMIMMLMMNTLKVVFGHTLFPS